MEERGRYTAILRQVVEQEAGKEPSHDAVEAFALSDDEHGHYQVLHLGWGREGRVFAVIIHLRLHNGKVYIERDGTEEGVATTLMAAGIPPEAIVLAFYPERKRAMTGFAVA